MTHIVRLGARHSDAQLVMSKQLEALYVPLTLFAFRLLIEGTKEIRWLISLSTGTRG